MSVPTPVPLSPELRAHVERLGFPVPEHPSPAFWRVVQAVERLRAER